ncbi:dihydrodipicolinate synthase family protein [Shinella sp. 838]|jgi:4-hydroxy-tetrahydrodipicolinate synthase|uniref:dihydrodipicolinate synthase family protein n=1 Tax=unclassified Shinella TaxID=2643062 RepID=UPI000437C489|nr:MULTISPECIES: dihydrodipicolinate synthase family protein [unclassified Shinella]EYR84109.1 dihydrodipicolinate synthase/N-acetyneuraminate lyase [Shinella sp. DD12]MCA0345343.1 dihydrodipicolinate synthase family protein [Pseudomonadota bacterium]MDG4675506.1 dihydrodipicolinate synthase family protein [Shinella sp. 838]
MARLTEDANGVYIIALTPFTDTGALDLDSADRMVDFYMERGATGLTVLGMMGEAQKLTTEESQTYVKRILKRVDGRVPVVAGVSSSGFAPMKTLTDMMMGDGAAGVMIAPPSMLRNDHQIVSYYRQAGDFLGDVPFVLQDFPLVTSVTIPVSVIQTIVDQVPTCVCLKHEDWPGLSKITALRQTAEAQGKRRISILCGNGGMFLPEEMARGADGAMTGFAYPEMMRDVVRFQREGDLERAQDIFDAYLPLARYEQQPGLGLSIRKYIMAKRGAIASASLRKPGVSLSKDDIREIERLIERQTERLQELEQ